MADDGLGDILMQSYAPIALGPTPYAQPDAQMTQLQPLDEMAFRQWVDQNNVPFNPNKAAQDYDMRGFYQGLQQEKPIATTAIDPFDQRMHFPDYYKMPSHRTFSQGSQWALPMAPRRNDQDQLVSPGGHVLWDDPKEGEKYFRDRGGGLLDALSRGYLER